MLKAVNIHKTYYTKTGASQKALNDVSLELDSKGLVFILGKSGSGKSTLLNILGGLDKMDKGNIEIKGKSSKNFTKSDFDSYRNTYLGFIFQDFNILPEFTVRQNINLAYELQHKKADEKKLTEILKEVDMLEYADRKPNELSGGQIQRVAIARALIKSPEIIMADEPTGNLDSETGKEVFKTLQNLAKEKLVLVVSHDREAAEEYADRIVELKDGKIIKDVTKQVKKKALKTIDKNIKSVGNKLLVKSGVKLTEKELEQINHASEKGLVVEFLNTAQSKDFQNIDTRTFIKTSKLKPKQKKFTPFKLIKSKLPNKNAFKMGKSSLKHKKVKLIFTLFLTIIALTLFGFADIMGNFSVAQASYNSYKNTSYSLLPFAKGELVEGDNYLYETSPTQDQLASFEHLTNQNAFIGHDIRIDFTDMLKNAIPDYNNYYIKNLRGVIEVPDKSLIKDEFIGDFPTNENEIVINNYMLEHFTDFGFKYYNEQTLTYNEVDTVTSFNDVKDKTIRARVKNKITELKIVGMVNYDLSMYEDKKTKWAEITESSSYNEKLELYMHADQYNFLGRLITSEGFTDKHIIEEYSEQEFSVISQSQGGGYNVSKDVNIELTNLTAPSDLGEVERYNYLNKDRIEIKKFNTINTNNYYFGNGVQTSGLAENDIIVPTSWFNTYNQAELDNYLNTTLSFKLVRNDYVAEEYNMVDYQKQLNIVGFCTSSAYYLNNDVVVADGVFDYIVDETVNTADYMYTYLNNDNTDAKLFEIMEQNNFIHKTDLSNEISNVAEMFEIMQKIFFYIAIVMAVFVAFMIMNFISASITYKKKEIGILRALGARKLDVFKVFYFEGLIIGLISYFITISLMFVGVILFNSFIQSAMNTNVVLISLSFRQIILVATICFGAIFASSYLPVNKIANKKPIDAIRNH